MAANVVPLSGDRITRAHLSRVFGTLPDGYHVVLFRLEPARSVSFDNLLDAASNASGQSDVWMHVGLTRRPYNGGDRPTALEIDGLSGMWADIDIADPVHKKAGLPPNLNAALAVAQSMGLPPGLIVLSGHGVQAWWPFAEVWTFDNDAERRRARILARAWAITLRERAKALGYTIDMVSDISRVLRVAGTVNAKAAPVPVTILEHNAASISEDDALGALLDGTWEQAERDIDQKRASGDDVIYGDLILDPKADPPWEKLDLLRDLEARADQAWKRKHSRRTEGWSASEWDQSLASYAADAEWTRQEIANLIIAARRKHGDDLKLRQDYYRMTIDKATAGREGVEALRDAVAVAEQIAQASTEAPSDGERGDMLAAMSKALGIEITRVTRSPSEPPVFGLETPYGSGSLGSIKMIASNQAFRNRVGEITNRFPKRLKNEEWDPLAQALLQVAEVEELGVETTLAGKAETLVSIYLGNHSRQVLAELSDKARDLLPIRMDPYVGADGATRIFATAFRVWLTEHQHEPMTRTEIGTMLRACGATAETAHFKLDGKPTTRSLWRLPTHESKGVDRN